MNGHGNSLVCKNCKWMGNLYPLIHTKKNSETQRKDIQIKRKNRIDGKEIKKQEEEGNWNYY
jgi:hypothetical protein